MKKILITGASGMIGTEVLKNLVDKGEYDITVNDLYNLKSKELFKKYKNKVKVVYGDLTDQLLVEDLVKEADIILHLASVLPPITSLDEELAKITELTVTENFIRAINYYNENVHFIYASSTSVYSSNLKSYDVTSKTSSLNKNYFSKYKLKSENIIKDKLKNYNILRIPLVLGKLKKEAIIYGINVCEMVSLITKEDAGNLFLKVIENKDKYNKKIINASGNESFNILYRDLISDLIKRGAFSFNMFFSLIFLDKNYTSPVLDDSPKFNKVLDYQKDEYDNYLNRIKYSNKNKYLSKLWGKVFLKLWERRK